MRAKLLASVAIAALVGCTTLALAQEKGGGMGGAAGGSGSAQMSPGGSGSSGSGGTSSSGGTSTKSSGSGGSSAQGETEKKGKGEPNKGLSQTQQPGGATQHGAQETGERNKGGTAQENSERNKGGTAQENSERNKGTSQNEERNKGQRGAKDNERNENSAQTQQRGGPSENNAQTQERGGGMSGAKSVQLSTQQRTQIKDIVIKERSVARVTSPSFSVSIGTRLPRDVHVAVLPPEVIRIVPEYRGFEYVVVGDQLLIVDPDTLEIVAVLPV